MKAADEPVLVMSDAAVASVHMPDLVVIDHVDWTVQRREHWVIGGPPASGKSDLLTTAVGLMRPARGSVRLFGKELVGLHEEERLQIQLRTGIVFGSGGRLFNHLTVAENLGLPLCYHHNCDPSASEDRVNTVLEMMGLSGIAQRTPLLVNRNLRQRVALARALVLAPELLFLDNPLAGLDPREIRWWLAFIERLLDKHPILNGRDLTLVVSTDDLQPWGEQGRQFAFIDRQRLVSVGSRADLAKLDTPALRELLPAGWLESK